MKRIAYKFAAVMLVMVVVALAAVFILGNNVTKIAGQSRSFMEHEVESIDTAHAIYEDYLQIYTAMYAHINTTLTSIMDTKADEIGAVRADMWQLMERFQTQIDSEEKQAVYDTIESKLTEYDAVVDEIEQYGQADRRLDGGSGERQGVAADDGGAVRVCADHRRRRSGRSGGLHHVHIQSVDRGADPEDRGRDP